MKQGEIWLIDLDPTQGAEIQKRRPAIIVNDNRLGKLPLKIIVPVTDWKEHYKIAPWMIKIVPDNHQWTIQNFSSRLFSNSFPFSRKVDKEAWFYRH